MLLPHLLTLIKSFKNKLLRLCIPARDELSRSGQFSENRAGKNDFQQKNE